MKKSAELETPAVLEGEWLTLAETMRMLGKSQSTVERMVAAAAIATKVEPRARRKPERLYNAADVRRMAENERDLGRSLRLVKPPVSTQLAIPAETISSLRDVTTEWGKGVTASLHEVMTEWQKGAKSPRLVEKLWLSLEEGAEYAGLPAGYLRRLIHDGQLVAIKTPGWRILRASLDEFSRKAGEQSKAAHAG
jgi:excisionase family DNA binding protein